MYFSPFALHHIENIFWMVKIFHWSSSKAKCVQIRQQSMHIKCIKNSLSYSDRCFTFNCWGRKRRISAASSSWRRFRTTGKETDLSWRCRCGGEGQGGRTGWQPASLPSLQFYRLSLCRTSTNSHTHICIIIWHVLAFSTYWRGYFHLHTCVESEQGDF